MGASGWYYFAPYQEDISQALQDLRQEVFEQGNYMSMWASLKALVEGGREAYLQWAEESFSRLEEEWERSSKILLKQFVKS